MIFSIHYNQVVKSSKDQYFDCFSYFSQFRAQKLGSFIIYTTWGKIQDGHSKSVSELL